MAGLAPFGFLPAFSPMLGDDEEERMLPTSETIGTTPTTDWESLRRAGYGVVRARVFEGIPYVFGQRSLYTVAGSEAAVPADYTFSAALVILPGEASSVEIDREKGIASARAIDTLLRRETLQDEGLLPLLFKTPSLRTRLTVAVTDPTSSVFTVASTTSWSASGLGYIGRELIRYSALDATHFAGITRGVCGFPYYHRTSAASGYSEVTDVPTTWRGRFWIEYEHLVSPEGRYLGDTWCSIGTYCREADKGYVDDVVQEHAVGKRIRCQALVRLCAQSSGAKITGRPVLNADRSPKLYWTASDTITARGGSTTTSGPVSFNDAMMSLRVWGAAAAVGLGANWTAWTDDRETAVTFSYLAGAANQVTLMPRAWFLRADVVQGYAAQRVLLVDFATISTGWLVLTIDQTEDATADDVPDRGVLKIEIGGAKELAQYDGVHRDSDKPTLVAVRIVSRGFGGTSKLDPWTREDATVSIVTGYQAAWPTAFRAMATSSGTGARGAFDQLGFGFGLGIPDDWIDIDSMSGGQMATTLVDALTASETTIAETLCGRLALWQKCLVQRRNDAGRVVLAVVDTAVTNDPTALTLTVDDVLLGGHGPPELLPAPNIIEVEIGDGAPKQIPRDRTRMANEGDRRWTLKATGARPDDVAAWATAILTMGDGQAALELEVPAWKDIQAGDQRLLTTAHPLVYDVTAAAYAPASIVARCMLVEPDKWEDFTRTRWLLAGQAPAATLLCPSARVRRVYATNTLEVEAGHEVRFAHLYKVYVYEPGNEATRKQAMTVAGVLTSPSRIQMTGSLPSWCNADTVVTYDDIATCVGDQTSFMFVRASKAFA